MSSSREDYFLCLELSTIDVLGMGEKSKDVTTMAGNDPRNQFMLVWSNTGIIEDDGVSEIGTNAFGQPLEVNLPISSLVEFSQ